MNELSLLEEADERARRYVAGVAQQRVFPDAAAIDCLTALQEPLTDAGKDAGDTLALMDAVGSRATVVNNGPNYFGFVIGATLPAAAAAERLAGAWDQCASTFDGSPAADAIEKQAAKWLLDVLDLPRDAAVAFGTSATACGLSALAAARADILARAGWDYAAQGLMGAPAVKVVVPETAHVTVRKALQILGFGWANVIKVPVDGQGRMIPADMPPLDDRTILILQAGEVNTGEFDRFADIIPVAKAAGAWVHVDGAFGLWARASALKPLTQGIEGADSWTTDGHKWLNTPYDGAMAICRDPQALARVMNSDAAYSTASADSQKNLTLEFSRRARGIPIWAALRTLGRQGVAAMVEKHHAQAQQIGVALRDAGFDVQNRVVLNQVLVRGADDDATARILKQVQDSGEVWFGGTVWQGRPAFRISLSSFRTEQENVDRLIALLQRIGPNG